ncbi:MAG: alanine--tRNA ligase [Candidatus Acidiferrales bacterium]
MNSQFSGNEIRSMFLRYFAERGHRVVRSSSLVPTNDPTLLFTNAGMNQFKDVFLGLEQRDYKTATSCQKCLRAGGKHNDLENVGFTNRHHTFFEMLGNFSFGDYFKKEAIEYAWELITSPDWFGMPIEKLYFTVFGGAEVLGKALPPDHDAASLWVKTGAPKDRVVEIPGLKENFWAMGDTGPCGPCSEIFYDMGPAASDAGHTDCKFPCDCGRYVEIWNLVFMQFNRDASGALAPLPKPSVDTGAGLERIATVLQAKISNYDTDLFQPLMQEAANIVGIDMEKERDVPYFYDDAEGYRSKRLGGRLPSLRIIADHSRAATFLIADGVVPSNEGRGYVLRKIIRRALVHVRIHLRADFPFLPKIAAAVVREMKSAYPELEQNAKRINRVLQEEEHRFSRVIETGLRKLVEQIKPPFAKSGLEPAALTSEKYIPSTKLSSQQAIPLTGEQAFKLYDTYGMPVDLMRDVLRDVGLEFDDAGFNTAMEDQRARARASWKGAHKEIANPAYAKLAETFKTEPDFYFGTTTHDTRIEAIVTKSGAVNEIKKGEEAEIVLDRTSIYAESGGQVADIGGLYDKSGSLEVAEVRGAYYPVTGLIAHRIVAKEDLRVGDRVATLADAERRTRNMRNHTATHLMHAALRNILGTHVKQAGSLVAPEHLRFDFSHFAAVDASELAEIEQQVNEEIRKNLEMRTDIMNIDDALASGALAFFGDKYPEANVRVVTIPDAASPSGFYSKELCGGTHVSRTGEIGVFKILSEQSVAAGVRRIDAISGDRALAEYQRLLGTLRSAASLLNASEDQIIPALERQIAQIKALEKQLEALGRKAAGSQAQELLESVRNVKGVRVIAAEVSGFGRKALRELSDFLRQKIGSGVIVLASIEDGKVALITAVTKDLTSKLDAGKMIKELAPLVDGSGGGKPDLAEAGGKDTSGIEKALRTVYPLLERLL